MSQSFRPGFASFVNEDAPVESPASPLFPNSTAVYSSLPTFLVTPIEFEAKATALDPEEAARRIAPTASGRTHLLSTAPWGWEQMRDYVVGEIESRWGAQPRDSLRESGIFKGFVNRWGDQAERIARTAFDVHCGLWKGAPVSVSRFATGSDPYFAAVIAKNLL